MVRVNCAATTALIDGRPFGGEKNLFASDDHGQVGRLELANGSTVFFDEIVDLSLEAQANLSRILEHGQIQSPGHGGPVPRRRADHRGHPQGPAAMHRRGTFREDLYVRLNVFPIHVPPLRERRDDIPVLVWRFVDEFSMAYRKPIDAIDQASMTALQTYSWPGNARELRNVVEQAMMGSTTRRLRIAVPSNDSITRRRKSRSDSLRHA